MKKQEEKPEICLMKNLLTQWENEEENQSFVFTYGKKPPKLSKENREKN